MPGSHTAPDGAPASGPPRPRAGLTREVCLGVLAGALLGVGLIHTTAAIVVAPAGAPWARAVADAFAPEMWGFVVYHAFVGVVFGAGIGAVLGLSHRRELAQHMRAAALERQLHQAQRLESLGRLAGGVAHDFNNLLTAMRTSLFLAGRRLPEDQAGARRHLDDAERVVERAARLPAQLLAFARRRPSEPKVVDPRVLVGELRRMLERVLGETIELDARFEEAGVVWVDPGQLEQVLVNLAVNARDAMPGGGTLTLRVSDTFRAAGASKAGVPPGPYVTIDVTDTGTGMPPEVLQRLFEPFFTTKPEGKGTGLGLATSYGIVRGHGGDIEVASRLGAGSTFRVLLPAATDATVDGGAGAPVAAAGPAAASGKGLRVLVVDDQAAVLDGTAAVLAEHGFEVGTARDGEEALVAVHAAGASFDVVLADVMMPRLDGVGLAARLGEGHAGVPVLLMSGNPEVLAMAHRSDATVLAKPFTPESLVEAVLRAARPGALTPARARPRGRG